MKGRFIKCLFLLALWLISIPIYAETYYQVLGLDHNDNPSSEDIKRAYRKKALDLHPDRLEIRLGRASTQGERDMAEASMKHLSEAYGVLNDPKKKQSYDKFIGKPTSLLPAAHEDEVFKAREMTEKELWSEFAGIFSNQAGSQARSTSLEDKDILNKLRIVRSLQKSELADEDWKYLIQVMDSNNLSKDSLDVLSDILSKIPKWPDSFWQQIANNIMSFREGTQHNKSLLWLIKTNKSVPNFFKERLIKILDSKYPVPEKLTNAYQNLRVAVVEMASPMFKKYPPELLSAIEDLLGAHHNSDLSKKMIDILYEVPEITPSIEKKLIEKASKIFLNNPNQIPSFGPYPNNIVKLLLNKRDYISDEMWDMLRKELLRNPKETEPAITTIYRLGQKFPVPEDVSRAFFDNDHFKKVFFSELYNSEFFHKTEDHPKYISAFRNFNCKSQSCLSKMIDQLTGLVISGDRFDKSLKLLITSLFNQIKETIEKNPKLFEDEWFRNKISGFISAYELNEYNFKHFSELEESREWFKSQLNAFNDLEKKASEEKSVVKNDLEKNVSEEKSVANNDLEKNARERGKATIKSKIFDCLKKFQFRRRTKLP